MIAVPERGIPVLDRVVPVRRLAVTAALAATAFAALVLDAALTEAAFDNGWPMNGYDGQAMWPVTLMLAWLMAAAWVIGVRLCWTLLRQSARSPDIDLPTLARQPAWVSLLAAWGLAPVAITLSVLVVGALFSAGLPGRSAMLAWFVGLLVAGAAVPRLGKIAAYLLSLSTLPSLTIYLALLFMDDGIAYQLTSPIDTLIHFAKG